MSPEKVDSVVNLLLCGAPIDEVFACGPEPMIHAVRERMQAAGVSAEHIHFELFTSPTAKAIDSKKVAGQVVGDEGQEVFIVIDGSTHKLDYDGVQSVLDVGLKAGLDLPYSCLGGVCCTCRARVSEGKGEMDINYALEPGEVEQGFVLTCQTKPVPGSGRFTVDFDQQ